MAAAAWCDLLSASLFVQMPIRERTGPNSSGLTGPQKVSGLKTEWLREPAGLTLPTLLP